MKHQTKPIPDYGSGFYNGDIVKHSILLSYQQDPKKVNPNYPIDTGGIK